MASERRYVIPSGDCANGWRIAKMAAEGLRTAANEGKGEGKPVEVLIREYQKNRSLAQNRLSHWWYDDRAKHHGTTADYEHRLCKLKYGCPILIAAEEDFAALFRRAIEPLDYEQRIAAMKYLPVTRLMKVKQMADYLTTVERESAAEGVPLRHPQDMYDEAMGK